MATFSLKIALAPGTQAPAYAKPNDAGVDLRATEPITLNPGQRHLIGTGLYIGLPDDYVAFVHPRSGLAAKHGITVVNAPGTVDAGYRGEIKVCLLNTDPTHPFTIEPGDRIAQLVFQKFETAQFEIVGSPEDLGVTERGASGHGSTGNK